MKEQKEKLDIGELGKKKEVSLLEGNISGGLIRFATPIFLALLLQVMYSSVDMLIVGNFSDMNHISGVSTGSQLMNTLTALCIGIAMGVTIFIGQKIGEHKQEELGAIIRNALGLFLGISIFTTLGFLIFRDGFVEIMNTPLEAVIQTSDYIFYCTLGIPFIFLYNVLSSVTRGVGDSKTPLIAVAFACVVNIIGDYVLIAVYDMGAGGAAIATVIAQMVSVLVMVVLMTSQKILVWSNKESRWSFRYSKHILRLGIPVALQSVMATFSVLIFTMIVNEYGVLFSAAIGLADKVTGLTVMVPSAFMQRNSI